MGSCLSLSSFPLQSAIALFLLLFYYFIYKKKWRDNEGYEDINALLYDFFHSIYVTLSQDGRGQFLDAIFHFF